MKRYAHFLGQERHLWDKETTRPAARRSLQRMLKCKTLALGARVYVTDSGERRVFPNTCKSKACASCGSWSAQHWGRQIDADLPELPCAGITLTMQSDFWELFNLNRHLLGDLPAIAAGTVTDWSQERFGAEIFVLSVPHTFGSDLKFNPHFHMLASKVGLNMEGSKIVSGIHYPGIALVPRWRDALLDYVKRAFEAGIIRSIPPGLDVADLVQSHKTRSWFSKDTVLDLASRGAFLRYMVRYLRRPPLADSRLLGWKDGNVFFAPKPKKGGSTRGLEFTYEEFVKRIVDQIPERYSHAVRYYGLLAPNSKNRRLEVFRALLSQTRRPRPKRMSWRASLIRTYNRDPLRTEQGEQLRFLGILPPFSPGAH